MHALSDVGPLALTHCLLLAYLCARTWRRGAVCMVRGSHAAWWHSREGQRRDAHALTPATPHVGQVIRTFEFYTQRPGPRRYKFDVLITTFELSLKDAALLSEVKWSYLVVDEAHRLKNNESALYRVRRWPGMLPSGAQLCLVRDARDATGGPLEVPPVRACAHAAASRACCHNMSTVRLPMEGGQTPFAPLLCTGSAQHAAGPLCGLINIFIQAACCLLGVLRCARSTCHGDVGGLTTACEAMQPWRWSVEAQGCKCKCLPANLQ